MYYLQQAGYKVLHMKVSLLPGLVGLQRRMPDLGAAGNRYRFRWMGNGQHKGASFRAGAGSQELPLRSYLTPASAMPATSLVAREGGIAEFNYRDLTRSHGLSRP